MIKYILLLACATAISGEEKWSWSSSNRDAQRNGNNQNDRLDQRQRLEDLRDRYEVEETTKRPANQKPQQDDEYFGGSPNTQRFNFNVLNGAGGGGYYPQGGFGQNIPSAFNGQHGPIGRPFQPNFGPSGGYPGPSAGQYPGPSGIGHFSGVGQYPGAGIGQYSGAGIGQYPGAGIGQYPGAGIGQYPGAGIGQYPGAGIGQYPGAGIGQYPGNIGGPIGGHTGPNNPGVLVGPGGPTGNIGRPGFGPNRAHPDNGILVGPGGPTGIIGRPLGGGAGLNGYGGGLNGYGGGYGPLGGRVGDVPGDFNGNGLRPSGPGVGGPYNSGSDRRPYAPEFDDYDNGVEKTKHVEKKSIVETN